MVVAYTFLTYEDETSDEFGIYIWSRSPGLLRRLTSRTSLTSNLPTSRNLVAHAIDSALHAEADIRQSSGGVRVPWLENLARSEEHTSELQSQSNLVCRLLLEKKKRKRQTH